MVTDDVNVEAAFAGLHAELRALEQRYNPDAANLHLVPLASADTILVLRLADLARGGLRTVQEQHAFFNVHPLYADGMFWYRLCLLIKSAAWSIRRNDMAVQVPDHVLVDLATSLVSISAWAARRPSDMYKRTIEALVGLLLAFPGNDLLMAITTADQQSTAEHVHTFVQQVAERVRTAAARRSRLVDTRRNPEKGPLN